MHRRAPVAAVLSLLGVCAWVYGAGLDRSPAYLVHDEVVYAINAHAIATTLHDINEIGRASCRERVSLVV